jgi:hypothetical protein
VSVDIASLWTLHAADQVHEGLTGRSCCQYTSPPQPRDQALALVQLLLSCAGHPRDESESGTWTRPIPGGQRTVTITPAPQAREHLHAGDTANGAGSDHVNPFREGAGQDVPSSMAPQGGATRDLSLPNTTTEGEPP